MRLWRTLGISVAVALALLLAVQGTASALVEQLTLDELAAEADSILVGEVTDIVSYEEGKGNIYTLVTISVEQLIKGESMGEVVVRLLGGEVDGLGLWVEDVPNFQLGERTVVFLEEAENAFEVYGWYQGKFTVRDNRVIERNQSLTNFMADISQAMEAQGITPKLSVKPVSMVLESPLESESVEPAETEEFQVGWENIMTDGFEEAWPGVWNAFAQGGYTSAYWGKDNYRAYNGSYSAFSAKSGAAGVDPPDNYPNNMNAWMVYGPFSLVGASDAELNYYLWLEALDGFDYIFIGASTNGSSFYGEGYIGSTDWLAMSFDLTAVDTLGDLSGESQVWIAFVFTSNSSLTYDGAFIDDVVLRKFVPGGLVPNITSISPPSRSAGTGLEVTITGTDFGATQDSSTVTFWRVGSTYLQATIVSWSDTEIVCEVPSGASSGTTSNGVRVTTSGGASNDFAFTVTFSYAERKWLGSNPMGEKYLINPNTADTTGEWQALIDAMQAWNDVDSANFYFEYGGLTTATAGSWSTPNDANEILWVNYVPPGFPSGWIAVNLGWYYSATGEIFESDIVFNDLDFTWDTSGSPSGSQMDVQNIATHELGHTLSLLDFYGSADSDKTMYGIGANGETKKRTLEADDIAGIQWIYSGTGTRGQYHISVTNNDDDDLTVYFKADTDADYEDYRQVDVPSGQTQASFWEVVSSGSHQVTIKWTDPDKGTDDFLTSGSLDVPVEGDTEFTFTIPQYPAAPTVTNATGESNVTSTSARLNGEVTDTGGENPTVIIYWGDNDGQTTPVNWDNEVNLGTKAAGTFYTDIGSLSPETTYYYRCYATNSGGEDWADTTSSFETPASGGTEKLIGVDDLPINAGSVKNNKFLLAKFTAEKSGAVTSFRINSSGSGSIKIAIYADNGGEPGALLNAVNTPQPVVAGWNSISLPSTEVVAGTDYWLAANSNAQIIGKHSGAAVKRTKAASFSTFTFPNPAGSEFNSRTINPFLFAGWGIQ